MLKVAALVDEKSGKVTRPQGPGLLRVYERAGDEWICSRQMSYSCAGCANMFDVRAYLETIAEWLGDCKIVAAGAGNGYFRVIFGSLGVALWAVRGTPDKFIDQIVDFYAKSAAEEAAKEDEEKELAAAIEPVPGHTGHYRIDLREAMKLKGVHNSRRVLLPFFTDAHFERLDIICDHVPKWFEYELPELGLRSLVESQSDFIRVHVSPTAERRDGRFVIDKSYDRASSGGCGGGCGGGGEEDVALLLMPQVRKAEAARARKAEAGAAEDHKAGAAVIEGSAGKADSADAEGAEAGVAVAEKPVMTLVPDSDSANGEKTAPRTPRGLLMTDHPCFDEAARARSARVH
ncbi:Fe-only nitrogenase accessory AnfO family protein, partial [Propionibacterium sp.]|uniref:Fe-only nitrogenase accessory AnfO family protein n=1 Tax=Propionibacterium sp. TaxID=1977903 RepID=UPI0039ED1531